MTQVCQWLNLIGLKDTFDNMEYAWRGLYFRYHTSPASAAVWRPDAYRAAVLQTTNELLHTKVLAKYREILSPKKFCLQNHTVFLLFSAKSYLILSTIDQYSPLTSQYILHYTGKAFFLT